LPRPACCPPSQKSLTFYGQAVARWLIVAISYAFLIYTYYVYVVVFCSHYLIHVVDQRVKSGLYLAFFQILFILTTFSFTRSTFSDPGDTRRRHIHPPDFVGPLEQHAIIIQDIETARYCGLCRQWKPMRTHHCSDCGHCTLKMDHHCVWINNCVGWLNYKQFVLLSFWGLLLCSFVFATTLQILIWGIASVPPRTTGSSVQVLLICIFSLLFWLVFAALFLYHVKLAFVQGRTTIEQLLVRDGEPVPNYDQGFRRNWTHVLGAKWYLWLVPYHNSVGDGVNFSINIRKPLISP
jgi:hypothetical protein